MSMKELSDSMEMLFGQRPVHGLIASSATRRANGKTILDRYIWCDVHKEWHKKGEIKDACELRPVLRDYKIWIDEAVNL